MKNKSLFILALIVLVGLGIRLFQLGKIPLILNRDEAALAYNALLISQTGKDEFGRTLPLTFESFGDYKLPGYIYTLALLFKVLPANDFVVRLPSVIAGTWLIIAGYLLSKNFSLSKKSSHLVAPMIALNPIFWFYSRIAFEANVALAFFATALFFLTKPKPTWKTDLGGVMMAILAIIFYNTPLLLLPFLGLSLIIMRGIKKPKSWLPVNILLGLIFIIFYLSLSQLTAQKSGITWFNDETTWDESVKYYTQFSGWQQKMIGNKLVFYLTKILPKFIQSFSWAFLVTTGGSHPWHTLPNWGHLFWPTYLFGLAGLFITIKKMVTDQRVRGLIFFLFASLIPSVITVDAPHATRSLTFFLLFVLLSAVPIELVKTKFKKAVLIFFVGAQIFLGLIYGYHYFVIFPNQQPQSLQIGFAEILTKIEQDSPTTKVAIVDPSGYQYILTAWYLKLKPEIFFATVIKQLPDKIGFKYGQQVSRYHFIAKASDRDSSELVLLEWKDNIWQIQ